MSDQNAANGAALRVYATAWCGDCALAKRVLDGLSVEYEWVDITGNQQAIDYVMSVNRGHSSVPTIVFPNGEILTEPSRQTLVSALTRLGYVQNADTHS